MRKHKEEAERKIYWRMQMEKHLPVWHHGRLEVSDWSASYRKPPSCHCGRIGSDCRGLKKTTIEKKPFLKTKSKAFGNLHGLDVVHSKTSISWVSVLFKRAPKGLYAHLNYPHIWVCRIKQEISSTGFIVQHFSFPGMSEIAWKELPFWLLPLLTLPRNCKRRGM